MTMTMQDTTPRIYVACLASYNNGKLYGKWIDATSDSETMAEEIKVMLAGSSEPYAEEFAIHDYENFGGLNLSEYTSLDKVAAIVTLIEEHGAELVAGLYDCVGGNLDEIERMFEDYMGEYDSLADYLQELTEDTIDMPEALRYYIDYDKMAHDEECNGTYTTIEVDGKVHIFLN